MKSLGWGLLIGLAAGFIVLTPQFKGTVQQPIEFNHQAHQDLECTSCHESVQTQAFAGLPTLDLCLLCHETPLSENPEEEKIRLLAERGETLQWGRLFQQPAHVFYSHRRHVGIAGLECRSCHGEIGNSTVPPRRVRNLTMDDCMSCHQLSQVADDCVDCHR